ncbi:MAG: hypothetical protein JWO46_725 [Nocardioidaceae bacterium]|nr:hypothetical protein [Nocardioidaceae bacterium]
MDDVAQGGGADIGGDTGKADAALAAVRSGV